MNPEHRPCRARGLTLVELLIGISMLSILVALAAPDFGGWLRSYRLTLQSNDFTSALAYARSEAVRRGTRVALCKSANPLAPNPACTTAGSWTAGWLVFADNVHVAGNAAGTVDGTDTVLRIGEAMQGAAITADANLGNWMAYTPDGLALSGGGSAAGNIKLCQGRSAQTVTLNTVGRVSTAKSTC